MASTRRPTYRAGSKLGTGSRPSSGGTGTDVISASKNAGDTGSGPGRNPQPAPDTGSGQVLSFPEPKGKRRRRILLSTIGIVAVLVAAIVAAAVYSPVLALRTVTVQGTKLLGADRVQSALAPLQGRPLPQISEADVTALLKPLVQVKDVRVRALPPSTLHVDVTERIPVALVKQGQTYQLVDVEGVQLSTTKDAASVSLPVIDGGGGTLPKDLFQAITAVLGALPAGCAGAALQRLRGVCRRRRTQARGRADHPLGQRGGEGVEGAGPRGPAEGARRSQEPGEGLRCQRAQAPCHAGEPRLRSICPVFARHAAPVIECPRQSKYRHRHELLDITITFKSKVKVQSFKHRLDQFSQ